MSTSWSCGRSSQNRPAPGSDRTSGDRLAQQRVQAPAGDDPPGLADAGGEVGLDPLPLAGERLLPVGLEQPQEPLEQAPRVVQQLAGQRLVARRGRALAQPGGGSPGPPAPPGRGLSRRRPASRRAGWRTPGAPAARPTPRSRRSSPSKSEQLPGGRREEELREVRAVREREDVDLPLQRRGEPPHRPHPLVLHRVVLGLHQHVQAQHRLQRGRVGEGGPLGGRRAATGTRSSPDYHRRLARGPTPRSRRAQAMGSRFHTALLSPGDAGPPRSCFHAR